MEGGVALSAQGGIGWRKRIYSLSETQQDRDRNKSTWAQTFLIFGQASWEGGVGRQQEALGWMQDWDECRV